MAISGDCLALSYPGRLYALDHVARLWGDPPRTSRNSCSFKNAGTIIHPGDVPHLSTGPGDTHLALSFVPAIGTSFYREDVKEEEEVTAFEYHLDGGLQVQQVSHLILKTSPESYSSVSFHPTIALLSFCRNPSRFSFYTDYEDEDTGKPGYRQFGKVRHPSTTLPTKLAGKALSSMSVVQFDGLRA